jgi:hypothetical protein
MPVHLHDLNAAPVQLDAVSHLRHPAQAGIDQSPKVT